MVQQVISAARRIPRNIKRAEPTEIGHLEWIAKWAQRSKTFASQRTFALSLALFFTCSRLSDLRTLPRGALFMDENCVEFHTGRMKNNQYQRDVNYKHMFSSKNPELCPVRHFKNWLQHPQCIQEEAAPIFQSTNDKWKPVTESCFRDNLTRHTREGRSENSRIRTATSQQVPLQCDKAQPSELVHGAVSSAKRVNLGPPGIGGAIRPTSIQTRLKSEHEAPNVPRGVLSGVTETGRCEVETPQNDGQGASKSTMAAIWARVRGAARWTWTRAIKGTRHHSRT